MSDALRRLYSWPTIRALSPLLRLGVTALAVIAFGMLWYVLFLVTAHVWAPPGSPAIQWLTVPHGSMDSIVVLGAWTTAYYGIHAWRQSEASARAAAAARARADRAQLDALRYQLNPHFLFNALSSIRTLISQDPAAARTMVTGFAEMLRNSLDASSVSEVPLRDEIAAIRHYLEIERVRFEDSLDIAIDVVPPAESELVPTLILHPLVENAIAHGCRTDADPLRIRIHGAVTPTGLHIEVANTGCLAAPARAPFADVESPGRSNSHGRAVGVASVRERLALLYPGRHRFTLDQDGPWVRATIQIDAPLPHAPQ